MPRLFLAAVAMLAASPAVAQTVVVLPYVQPGDGRTLDGTDLKVVRWFTDQRDGDFRVEYSTPGGPVRVAVVDRIALDFPLPKRPAPLPGRLEAAPSPRVVEARPEGSEPRPPRLPGVMLPAEKEARYFRYTAKLDGLPFDSAVTYRVTLGGQLVREATAKTRASADKPIRCVMVGDLAQGRPGQKVIANLIAGEKPDFLVALGDIVYPAGRMLQYTSFYWGTYNDVPKAGPNVGAPLMATVPFYPVLGNHDAAARLATTPDALAIYYVFAPPGGGPGPGPWVTPLGTDASAAAKFLAATRDSYPNMDAYSFDYGPVHFTVLNMNKGGENDTPKLRDWLAADLKGSKAKWKVVSFHEPAFHSSKQHYTEQYARRLHPVFEAGGVDVVFAGHVHNYQRSVPLRFAPAANWDRKSKVNGTFTLDTEFDGVTRTVPKGVIHIVAGGGGATLYSGELGPTAAFLQKQYGAANYVPFTTKLVATEHSFVVLDVSPEAFKLRAVGATGAELDAITITK